MLRKVLFMAVAVAVSFASESAALADNSTTPTPLTLRERAIKIQGILESMRYLDHCLRPDLERQITDLDQLLRSYPSDQCARSRLNWLKDDLHRVYADLVRNRATLALYIQEQEEAWKKLPPDTPDS